MTDLTYVIADLHGRADLLRMTVDAINGHADRQPSGRRTVVTLGDYVDRGPDSKGVIDQLMLGATAGWTMVNLRGNHEQMMLDALLLNGSNEDWRCWVRNGGDATLASYRAESDADGQIDPVIAAADHLRWMDKLPLIHSDRHRVYVHADVDPTLPLGLQREAVLLWSRQRMGVIGHDGKHVVVGHTPDHRNPRTMLHRTDLDTMAYETGRLAVAVFNDELPGEPRYYLDIRGERGVRVIHREAWMD